jgi:AcrR family transcriptional regulator
MLNHSNGALNGGRRERRRQETHSRIFDAAMRLFAERGFANTPVEEITEAADVAKGTFFNYFPTKESILESLAERQIAVVKAAAERARTAESVRPILLQMVHELARKPSRSPLLLRSLIGVALTNNTLAKLFGRALELGREQLASIMQRGQELGEVRRDVPAAEVARVMQHAIFGTNMIWSLTSRNDLDAWIDKTFDIVWRGIAAEPMPAGAARGSTRKPKEKAL